MGDEARSKKAGLAGDANGFSGGLPISTPSGALIDSMTSAVWREVVLTPEDGALALTQWEGYTLEEVNAPADFNFQLREAYEVLARYFLPKGELETLDTLTKRLTWPGVLPLNSWGRPGSGEPLLYLKYHLWILRKEGRLVAVRDHSVLIHERSLARNSMVERRTGAEGGTLGGSQLSQEDRQLVALVHLSHLWIEPAFRRLGLSPWLRAWPAESARTGLKAVLRERAGRLQSTLATEAVDPRKNGLDPLLAQARIDLVGEMEPLNPQDPDTKVRMQSYLRGGFLREWLDGWTYLQPDFRAPELIDAPPPDGSAGRARGLPLELLVRSFDGNLTPLSGDRRDEDHRSAQMAQWTEGLYEMYGQTFRSKDMAVCWENLKKLDPSRSAKPSVRTGVRAFYTPKYVTPLGEHKMPIQKFGLVAEALRGEPWVTIEAPEPLEKSDFLAVHDPAYIQAVESGEPRVLAESQKFPWSPELYPSVCYTAGGLYAAACTALQEGQAAALVSGFHHAHRTRGEGFCTFNGLVVAGEKLRRLGKIKRLAILDLDLHYGNGTAQLAQSRPWMRALSIYGNDYWENTAYREVTPRRHEDGANHRSAALGAGSDWAELERALRASCPWLVANDPGWGRPDLLIYQAGADPYFEDPYSPLALDHEGLRKRDRWVFEWAQKQQLPIAWVLAGGYTKDISKIVKVHVNTFNAWKEVFGS